MNDKRMLEIIHDQYSAVARSALTNHSDGVAAVAQSFGYTAEQLASLPPQANMGLSCGNPVAVAGLRPGEVVIDLGCGGGLDVFLAAGQVGPTGRVTGIDMSADMLERARAGAAQDGVTNVEFHQARIDQLPLADNLVDCILSNCVINLAPDKPRVFREMLRVLKPGGRLAISDIALRQALPPEVEQDIQAHVGCIAGAILIEEYERLLRQAGFMGVVVTATGADLNAYAKAGATVCCTPAADATSSDDSCCGSSCGSSDAAPFHEGLASVLREFDANAYAASVRIHALKG